MQNSTKALLWVLLVFLIGTAFGAAVIKLSQRSRLVADDAPPAAPVREQVPANPASGGRRGNRSGALGLASGALERMLNRLDMNPNQAAQAREILEAARGDYVRADQRRNQQQRMVRQRALRELREILNPRQRRQLRLFLNQLQEGRRQPQ